MTLTGMMPHRVRVKRRSGNLDRFGQFLNDRTTSSEFRCRLNIGSGGERFEERSREVYIKTYRLYYENKHDLREDDNVEVYDPKTGNVLLPDGNVTQVKHVWGMSVDHHREALISVVEGPDAG